MCCDVFYLRICRVFYLLGASAILLGLLLFTLHFYFSVLLLRWNMLSSLLETAPGFQGSRQYKYILRA